MQAYKSEIKVDALTPAGVTLESYEAVALKNTYGNDPIDVIIITLSAKLVRRHKKVFGLAYHCHSAPKIQKRLKEEGVEVEDSTFYRYLRDSKAKMIELVKQEEITPKIKEVL